MSSRRKEHLTQTWYERTWRPAMAFLYLMLCVLDYGVRPAINIYFFRQFDLVTTVREIRDLDSSVQIQVIETLRSKEAVSPILTEFVHLSFGAILGVAAFTRGREEIERTKRTDPKDLTNNNPRKKEDEPVDERDDTDIEATEDDGSVG